MDSHGTAVRLQPIFHSIVDLDFSSNVETHARSISHWQYPITSWVYLIWPGNSCDMQSLPLPRRVVEKELCQYVHSSDVADRVREHSTIYLPLAPAYSSTRVHFISRFWTHDTLHPWSEQEASSDDSISREDRRRWVYLFSYVPIGHFKILTLADGYIITPCCYPKSTILFSAAYTIVLRSSEYELPPDMLDEIVARVISTHTSRPADFSMDWCPYLGRHWVCSPHLTLAHRDCSHPFTFSCLAMHIYLTKYWIPVYLGD